MYLILVLLLTSTILAQDFDFDCKASVDLGTACSQQKPILKYHFDSKTQTCLAFLYQGCGGNLNRFDSTGLCNRFCRPIDKFSCPLGSPVVPGTSTCRDSSECGSTGYCKRGSHVGLCCQTAYRDKSHLEYNPKCPSGKSVYKIASSTFLGKSCKSNHCPENATCIQGEYFATCCV
ncbi:unnamed protein product [Caenorhabditis angaria]|uniref:BPTI/Kunitz inhibitor domain-containing protein n=1 Tax=Caenorhabditis angaria TaxID=860376 RepID=A0A9P1MXJ7_9PELO|nr:unnamed protein product [Caenorhabditis angaria]